MFLILLLIITEIYGSGALSDKILLVRIVENNRIDDFLRAGQVM